MRASYLGADFPGILVSLNRVQHAQAHTLAYFAPCEGHTGRLITRSVLF